jgi:hypothetical protein
VRRGGGARRGGRGRRGMVEHHRTGGRVAPKHDVTRVRRA